MILESGTCSVGEPGAGGNGSGVDGPMARSQWGGSRCAPRTAPAIDHAACSACAAVAASPVRGAATARAGRDVYPRECMATSSTPETQAPYIGPLSNTFAELPREFGARLSPTPVAGPRLIRLNEALARGIGLELDALDARTLAAVFSGNVIPQGATPVAMAYAGHQFGHFVPQLGDGRAILLAEVVDAAGVRRDIHLKGSGRTPYSRGGDGRAGLGPVLREYLISEAMHALGIPTTRTLAAVASGEPILRDGPTPGAVLARIGASHIRVGTFEFHAARGNDTAVRTLADYVIARHYPGAREAGNPYLALLSIVADRQATLVSEWMRVGFIHGVMNTDNMAVSGETIDFGPCAFMDAWDPATVFSSIDHRGRYAFANQPAVAQWNLARLAETLLPLIDSDVERAAATATDVIIAFLTTCEARWQARLRGKIGLAGDEPGDGPLTDALLEILRVQEIDYTQFFWHLADFAAGRPESTRALFQDPAAFDAWSDGWRGRLARDPRTADERCTAMRRLSPAIIARNHQVEHALRAAVDAGDFAPFHALADAIARPYAPEAAHGPYAVPPQPAERVLQTFCGT